MGRAPFACRVRVQSLPVGGAVELRVDALLVHQCPGGRGDEELLVDAVS